MSVLASIMKEQGVSVLDLASRTSLSTTAIVQILQGGDERQPLADSALPIAEALQRQPEVVFPQGIIGYQRGGTQEQRARKAKPVKARRCANKSCRMDLPLHSQSDFCDFCQ